MITFSQLGRYGRLGNQMFQIASTIGIAIKNDYDYAFPEWKNYDAAERFGSKEDIDVQKWFKNRLPIDKDWCRDNGKYATGGLIRPTFNIPFGFHGFDIPDNVDISGHMQSEKYFEHCEDVVRKYFEFAECPFLNDSFPDQVAIHIRLGDYSNQQGYHPICSKEYYEQAIKQMGEDSQFDVFSDDNEGAKELFERWFGTKYNFAFAGVKMHYIEELQGMSLYHSFITSNSTFSWWAAWLSKHPDKKIIQPSNWFGPAWKGTMDAKDIYIKNAKVI